MGDKWGFRKGGKIMAKKYVKMAIVVVAAVFALLGVVAFDWVSSKMSAGGASESMKFALGDLKKAEAFGFMNAFAVISYIVALATAVVYVVNQFVEIDVMKKVQKYLAMATALVALILVVALMIFCIKNTQAFKGVKQTIWWAFGAYATVIGTAVTGVVATK